jgi:hypothetical protein
MVDNASCGAVGSVLVVLICHRFRLATCESTHVAPRQLLGLPKATCSHATDPCASLQIFHFLICHDRLWSAISCKLRNPTDAAAKRIFIRCPSSAASRAARIIAYPRGNLYQDVIVGRGKGHDKSVHWVQCRFASTRAVLCKPNDTTRLTRAGRRCTR